MNRLLNWLLSSKSTRRDSARRSTVCLLGIERLGGAGTPAAGRRLDWSYRPSYERLEERQMLSTTCIISAATTAIDTSSGSVGNCSILPLPSIAPVRPAASWGSGGGYFGW
jgi:hypothetical protein